MSKRVLIIASGETERRALPFLLRQALRARGLDSCDVRIPPGGRRLSASMIAGIARSAWFELEGSGQELSKVVVLLDTDGKPIDDVIGPLEEPVRRRVEDLPTTLKFAVAQRHLEAWFFGDEQGLRTYLGRALGHVDPSAPDELEAPKLHLRNLLRDGLYTARIAEEIASRLNPEAIYGRSPSFAGFVNAVRNGGS